MPPKTGGERHSTEVIGTSSKDQGDEERNQEQSPRQEQEKKEAPGPSFLRRKGTKGKGLGGYR